MGPALPPCHAHVCVSICVSVVHCGTDAKNGMQLIWSSSPRLGLPGHRTVAAGHCVGSTHGHARREAKKIFKSVAFAFSFSNEKSSTQRLHKLRTTCLLQICYTTRQIDDVPGS